MLAMVVGVVALTGWRPGRTWSLLLAGLSALVFADIAFTLQSTDEALPGGNWIDPIYLIARGLPRRRRLATRRGGRDHLARRRRRREMVVPAVFAGVMIGLFAMQYFSATSGLSTVLWAATMTAVVVRLAMSDRENRELLEQVRTDALTGLGNRGRHAGRPAEAMSPRRATSKPVAAAALRPQRLQALQRHLRPPRRRRAAGPPRRGTAGDAVGEDGTAYRIGGDEFCVLLTCAETASTP